MYYPFFNHFVNDLIKLDLFLFKLQDYLLDFENLSKKNNFRWIPR